MSSNAFARTRPRVRHQRVPRVHTCDHPRFLQLVNELARLNDCKKEQQAVEIEKKSKSTSECSGIPSAGACTQSNTIDRATSSNDEGCSQSGQSHAVANQCSRQTEIINYCRDYTLNNNDRADIQQSNTSSENAYTPNVVNATSNRTNTAISNTSAEPVHQHHLIITAPSINDCCASNSVSNAPNGYRLINCRHTSSPSGVHNLSFRYQQIPQFSHDQNRGSDQSLNDDSIPNTIPCRRYNTNDQQQSSTFCGSNQIDDCCRAKGSHSGVGQSKHNVLTQNSPGHAQDLRQDENRSKRKRSTVDCSSSSKKSSMSNCGSGSSSKKHKSSEITRPLSPSFTKCPICLLDCMDRDPSFTNTCFHLFCFVCIENWTKNKATCPLCRTKFTKIIYNIKSATSYDEKIASPIRRDDDEGFIPDRLMLEHLTALNPNTSNANRNSSNDEVQFLFENMRSDMIPPQYFVNQIDSMPPRETMHPFNAVTTANFNHNVPPPFTPTSYPMASIHSISILPQNRISSVTNPAISGAYVTNNSLTNINTDTSNRRASRSGRYAYRPYGPPPLDEPSRVSSRATSHSMSSQTGAPIERYNQLSHPQHQHSAQHPHPIAHQHQPQGVQQLHHRSIHIDLNLRQNPSRVDASHAHFQQPYSIHRSYNLMARTPYDNGSVVPPNILNSLYRHTLPEM